MNMPNRLEQRTRRVWELLRLTVKKILLIDVAHWAGAFAFNAFFSLFPLIVPFVTIASVYIDREQAGMRSLLTWKDLFQLVVKCRVTFSTPSPV
ncbi:MAG: hypothetical protein CVU51_00150 [Deltaproteobacteria bacterium HGW-Deltaproteobacteria-1]|nr:MAG: hypothetical protein CVU51_00150 [Deltaproteobacteria bacterium HGW-Deltaproteobacteria-1]